MLYIETIIAICIAYLIGSISTAILICKIMRLPDPRNLGSKNPGATNVLRFGGKIAATITLIGDFIKGVIPVLVAKWYGLSSIGIGFVALAVFLGHLFPIFFGFKGGKGVATAGGCLIALSLPVGLSTFGIWLATAIISRYSSLAAIIAAIAAPFATLYFTNVFYALIIAVMTIFIIIRHKKNIENLMNGKEGKIGKK